MNYTIVNYYGKQTSKCGYCKGEECSIAHGMHAYHISPPDYQDLIDRGWRRSGHYCYKPLNSDTCCPCYTIRCNALEFKLSKSHKRIIKRMNRFLRDGKKEKSEELPETNSNCNRKLSDQECAQVDNAGGGGGTESDDTAASCSGGNIRDEPQAPDVPLKELDLMALAAANAEKRLEQEKTETLLKATATECVPIQAEEEGVVNASNSSIGSKQSYDSSKPPPKKAKQMRLERKQAKLLAKGIDPTAVRQQNNKNNQEKTLDEYFKETSETDKHKLQIVLVPSNTQSVTEEAFQLYRKYQLIIHNDNPQRLTHKSLQRFCYKSPLQLRLVYVKSTEFMLTLTQTFKVYEKYQVQIHDDPTNCTEYLEFLQRSPLELVKTSNSPPGGYGSFHQQYWLDDKLIAVAVIDILPHCLSSVYFFYDPEYSFLSLGTYGSLREIHFVQQLAAKLPALKWYYMGFYIHSCPKMRYKGKLVPSELLCPETYTWKLIDEDLLARLDAAKYQRLNADASAKDAQEFSDTHLDRVMLLLDGSRVSNYRNYIQSFNIESLDNMLDVIRSRIYKEITGEDDDRESILEYGRLVGKACAHRMLYLKLENAA